MKKISIGILCIIGVASLLFGSILWLHQSNSNLQTTTYTNVSDRLSGSKEGFLTDSPNVRIVLNSNSTEPQSSISVYHTVPGVLTNADILQFAKKFNISNLGEPKEAINPQGDTIVSVSSNDRRYHFMLSSNGGQMFEDSARSDTPNDLDIAANLPSDQDAEKIATAFLKKRDLLPEGAVFTTSKHNKAFRLNDDGSETLGWEDILLEYNRTLDGLPVEGTQFMIEVGAHGDIISFFTNWKNYQSIGTYPVKTPNTAFTELGQRGLTSVAGPDMPDTVTINQVSLAYHTTPLADHEEYLEPVWVFEGQAYRNGTPTIPIEEFIPALTGPLNIQNLTTEVTTMPVPVATIFQKG